jgi:raffinose/stachyose/melibiose transport system permease protein
MTASDVDARAALKRSRTRSGRNIALGSHWLTPYLFLLPAVVIYTLFAMAPIVGTVVLSGFQWDGITSPTWVGAANYTAVFADPSFQTSLINVVKFLPFYAVFPVLVGLLLVVAMTRRRIRGLQVFRAVLFLPYTLALVVVAISWEWILSSQGPLAGLLTTLHLSFLVRPWLGDFFWALPSLGAIGSWVWYGLAMVLFLAGVQRIPKDLYDAARVDGAGPIREFLYVTLPGLRYEMEVVIALAAIAAIRNFELIFVTTHGGPGTSTLTPAFIMYLDAFNVGEVGSAAAIAVVLTLMILAAVVVVRRLFREG